MSFRGNGQHRYGHVPPAQYGPAGGHDQNNPNTGLQRQSSFDNGDDARFFDQNSNTYQPGPPPARPSHQGSYGGLTGPHSPGRSVVGSVSPAISGYQHQYQPYPQSNSQSPPTPSYNPQNFPRSQSQSQHHAQYRPQPAQSTYNTAQHQPYNPALYSTSPPGPVRHATVSGYAGYNQQQYGAVTMPQIPQSPGYFSPTQQYTQAPTSRLSPQPIYEHPTGGPGYQSSNVAAHSSPQPTYPSTTSSAYNGGYDDYRTPTSAQAPPYPEYAASGQPAMSQAGNVHNSNSFSNRTAHSVNSSNAPVAIPTGPQPLDSPAQATGLGLQRHPTLRPLPVTPMHEDSTDDDEWEQEQQGRSEQDILQEQLFSELLNTATNPTRPEGDGDLLDSELEHIRQHGPSSTSSHTTAQDPNYKGFESSESDLEAAAGLEAMRIAEEQDARGGAGSLTFGAYAPQSQHQASHDESSDSDYKHYDLGLVGGGYDMSFGGEHGTGHSSELEDQSRPLPTAQDLGRNDSYNHAPSHAPVGALGGMTDYSIPGTDSIHPFPSFDPPARVDTSGTGGLQRPSSSYQPHRLSFDEGDEHVSLHSRVNSRASDGSESPSRDDMPELFYHPGMGASPYNHPLPAVPSMSENRTPQLQAAGSYRQNHQYNHSYSSSTEMSRPYVPSGPESYSGTSMLTPGGQYVPRSTSLSSHSSTPQAVPPTRSKTDAEERQARQKAARSRNVSGLDGYSVDTPQSTIALDLPALPDGTRRKKFTPSRLSTSDFKKCLEPWALSGIAMWVRELAGGETGEGETDLRQKTIEDGLVALFTHKVPTMNTADAETLSQKVVKSMLDAGLLIPEEEWVKFGQGSVSGVLWQLTGSGCYSPKVHEQEVPGRCYSHHCTRTLKKINLQAAALGPQTKMEDWATFFKLTKEQIEGAPRKEIERQNNLHEIVQSEDTYMDHINILRVLYRDDLLQWQPPIIASNKLNKFVTSVFGKIDKIKEVNENYLLAQLKYRQKEQGPWILGFSDIFREWIRKARLAYVEYAAGFPYAVHLVRKEAGRNMLFSQFLDQARDNKLSGRLDWNTYLKAPITRLQRYGLLLGTVHKNMTQETEEKTILATAIEEIKAVTMECDAKVDEQTKKVQMIELQSKLLLRPGMGRVELNLEHLGRELIFKGDLQRPGANRFTWLDTHAILFDHYLVLAKIVVKTDSTGRGKKEVYDVSKLPIPMQLLVLESVNDDPVSKGGVKGIGAVTVANKNAGAGGSGSRLNLNRSQTNGLDRTSTLEQTNSASSIPTVNTVTRMPTGGNEKDDDKTMYPFRLKHLGQQETYTLYAPTAQNRQDWCEKILEAKTRHAASLFEQNAEPFRLNVMADSAFAYDAVTVVSARSNVSVKGTPLERAIRTMEDTYPTVPRPAPVCRATVNCATAFNCYGKPMVAIGTDYGVFTAEANNPRGWTRSIQVARVTQIAVLEEFSLCLVISDKSLIAYHLDVVVPVSNFPAPHHDSARRAPQKLSGARDVSFFATARMKDRTLVFYKKREGLHSTFKVLEPVFQKATEKKSRFFGKKLTGNTEFFREFDEFYIPTECFTINLFHTYIAISTLKGFELMTLDKKVPMSIPDTKNPAIASIANRLNGQKPLGMFRLSDAEFLLCYEECGVYVDKHGEVSRSVILEFVGRAKTAAMYGAYLVLFDSDFVEVRNAENGRLRQVIAGRDVRCLDYGINPLGAGGNSSHVTPGMGISSGSEKRTLKLAMAHPEIPGSQIVLEMVLNEGHFE